LIRIAECLGIQKIGIDETGEYHAREKSQTESCPLTAQFERRYQFVSAIDLRKEFDILRHLSMLQSIMQLPFLIAPIRDSTVVPGDDIGQHHPEAAACFAGKPGSKGGMIHPDRLPLQPALKITRSLAGIVQKAGQVPPFFSAKYRSEKPSPFGNIFKMFFKRLPIVLVL